MYPKHDQVGHKDGESRVRAIRDTWYRDFHKYRDQIDLKFFYGWGADRDPLPDEVFLDAPDYYHGLPAKVQKIFQYCTDSGYTDILKLDDDVYLWVSRLLENFEPTDYRGYLCEADIKYASGTAYWVSAKAARIVAESPLDGDWAEDKFVGRTLARNGIKLVNDERYLCCSCDACLQRYDKDSLISIHTTHPSQMEIYHG